MFQLVDSVTGVKAEYEGLYTLAILAGGPSYSEMRTLHNVYVVCVCVHVSVCTLAATG